MNSKSRIQTTQAYIIDAQNGRSIVGDSNNKHKATNLITQFLNGNNILCMPLACSCMYFAREHIYCLELHRITKNDAIATANTLSFSYTNIANGDAVTFGFCSQIEGIQ